MWRTNIFSRWTSKKQPMSSKAPCSKCGALVNIDVQESVGYCQQCEEAMCPWCLAALGGKTNYYYESVCMKCWSVEPRQVRIFL